MWSQRLRGDCGAPFEAWPKAPSEAKWGGGEGGIAGFLSEHTRILSCVADYDLLARALAPTQKCGLGREACTFCAPPARYGRLGFGGVVGLGLWFVKGISITISAAQLTSQAHHQIFLLAPTADHGGCGGARGIAGPHLKHVRSQLQSPKH